jgi:hypothetical protein
MNLPGFTAELSLGKPTKSYHGTYLYDALSLGHDGLPATVLPSQFALEDMEDLEGLEEAEPIEEIEEIEAEDEEVEAEVEEIASEEMEFKEY